MVTYKDVPIVGLFYLPLSGGSVRAPDVRDISHRFWEFERERQETAITAAAAVSASQVSQSISQYERVCFGWGAIN